MNDTPHPFSYPNYSLMNSTLEPRRYPPAAVEQAGQRHRDLPSGSARRPTLLPTPPPPMRRAPTSRAGTDSREARHTWRWRNPAFFTEPHLYGLSSARSRSDARRQNRREELGANRLLTVVRRERLLPMGRFGSVRRGADMANLIRQSARRRRVRRQRAGLWSGLRR